MARLDHTPKTVSIIDLSHDGRGVARWPEGQANAGKTVFVSGALPGETVSVQQTARSRHFDEAKTLEVLEASPDRVTPRCPHFGTCGGCVLQHLAEDKQIEAKQRVLLDNLQRIGHVTPGAVLPPLRGDSWGYRRKGRFSVRRVEKKDKTLVGFREQDPRFVADIGECHVVVPQLGFKVAELGALVDGLDARRDIPQIEFIAGDAHTALIFRHLQPLSDADKSKLEAFAAQTLANIKNWPSRKPASPSSCSPAATIPCIRSVAMHHSSRSACRSGMSRCCSVRWISSRSMPSSTRR